jgi:putative ABC transport system permease protein
MKLLLNLIRKDFKRNRVITIALSLFIFLSMTLMATGLGITGTMISSLNGLNEIAVPPDYLQMHKGSIDESVFNEFVDNHSYIKAAHIVKMLNIVNADISYKNETLEKFLMDNGFTVQTEKFDFLLDMDNEIAVIKEGEIGVPVYYALELGVKVGDTITLSSGNFKKELTVASFIRDAAMNAPLASSKRFLVTEKDLDDLSLNMGEWEYSFEFLLEDGANMATLQRDYLAEGLPSNGVGITGSLLTMLNSMSYGLVALLIMGISFLLIIISVLCLTYIIKATLAEENHTIGEFKAIGFSDKSIKKLFQLKYIILVMITAVIGFVVSIPLVGSFASSVVMYCGEGQSEWMKWLFPFLGLVFLSIFVIFKCGRIIGKNINSTVRELMFGLDHVKKEGHYKLPKKGYCNVNHQIALGELKCKWKQYFTIFLVFVFATMLILIPMNMRRTIENKSFITYMGVAESDIRIDIQYSDNLVRQKEKVIAQIENDPEIERFAIYKYGNLLLKSSSEEWEYIRVQSGEEAGFNLKYLQGKAPKGNGEIALSAMNAEDLGKKTGDSIVARYQNEEIVLKVSGIYQDVTYGGKTAKSNIDFKDEDVEVYIVYLNVNDKVSIETKVLELRNILEEGKVTPVVEFVSQTLGGIIDYLILVELGAIIISLMLIILITILVLRLITTREHSDIAIKKAIGFTNRDVRIQYGIRIMVIQILAILMGTLLANITGESIMGMIFSTMGASSINILVDPLSAYVFLPLAQIFVVFVTVVLGTKVIDSFHVRDQIME